MAALPPLHHEVKVDLDPQQAFELFTDGIGEWWPLESFSVHGTGATVVFTDGGRLVERQGEESSAWGEVIEWVPGERVAMTWHPDTPPEQASRVTVSFTPYDDQTLVILEHTGWEVYEDAVASRNNYSGGWATVIGAYAGAGQHPDDAEPAPATWAALLFTPAEGQGAAVFEDERFPGHITFLNQMEEAGYLVAAGPMLDHDGSGMTILKLPGEGRLEDAEHLAHGDASVSSGLFEVNIRPWRVFFAPGVS